MMMCTDVQDELNAVEKQKNNSKMTKKWASNENHFLMKARECLTKNSFELDIPLYVADNMDPAVKTHMESNYKGHYQPRARDWKTQMKAFRELIKHAAAAE